MDTITYPYQNPNLIYVGKMSHRFCGFAVVKRLDARDNFTNEFLRMAQRFRSDCY